MGVNVAKTGYTTAGSFARELPDYTMQMSESSDSI